MIADEKTEMSSDLEEGAFTDASSNASPSEEGVRKETRPERILRRSAATRALPGLVLHVFHIDAEGQLEPYEDAYKGLDKALTIESNSSGSTASIKDKKSGHQSSYWVDIDADERDRQEVNEWIEKLNFGSLITDTITKPTEGMNDTIGQFNIVPSVHYAPCLFVLIAKFCKPLV